MQPLQTLHFVNRATEQQRRKDQAMAKKIRILIVEDEEAIRQGLVDLFVFHGYDVETAEDGRTGLEKATNGTYDLIILDVMLPAVDGFTICNAVRKKSREQPIIMLTAKTTDNDIITGLTLGADDYIAKPFSVRELVLRVESVLRRSRRLTEDAREIQIGAYLTIDTKNLLGRYLDGSIENAPTLEFTRREVEILRYLQLHQDRPVSRAELLLEVWGYQKASSIETRTVDIHIAKLRKKIEPNPKAPIHLVTVRGEGYKLL